MATPTYPKTKRDQRQYPESMDITDVWSSRADAENYALNDPTAYPGQILAYLDGTKEKGAIIQPDKSIEDIGTDLPDIIAPGTYNNVLVNNKGLVTSGENNEYALQSDVDEIAAVIPATANPDNQLADKDFVNSSITAMVSRPLTYDAAGNPFPTKASLDNATVFYNKGVPVTPTENDYLVVQSDETQQNGQVRYVYDGENWVFSYKINDKPFTAAQNAAINSGITAELVAKIGEDSGLYELSVSGSGVVANWAYDKAVTFTGVVKGLITALAKFTISGSDYDENSLVGVTMTEGQYVTITLTPAAGIQFACVTLRFEVL